MRPAPQPHVPSIGVPKAFNVPTPFYRRYLPEVPDNVRICAGRPVSTARITDCLGNRFGIEIALQIKVS